MTTSFYAPVDHFSDDRVVLPEDEARHAVGVLRHGVGDVLRVVDGEGRAVFVRLDKATKTAVEGIVEREDEREIEPPIRVTIGIGMIKHRSRFETLLEKATELGVRDIVPLITWRTERDRIREERAEGILVSAMKQSHRSWLPRLHEPTPVSTFVETSQHDARVICHEAHGDENASEIRLRRDSSLALMIGPEGGFTEDEVGDAVQHGWQLMQFGPRRLRAETAAIAAIASIIGAVESQPRFTI
jgi:16S rRNA (uracil1498-N3)-methyltransferase